MREPATGKYSLIGIFYRLMARRFPTQRPLSLYIILVDAEGRYNLEARLVRTDTGEELGRARGETTILNRLYSSNFHIPLPAVEFPVEGRYEFQIWANDVFIGRTFIDAVLDTT